MGFQSLNLDFSKHLTIQPSENDWSPSNAPGVERQRLEREHAESGWTTSIVRYAPNSFFPSHSHPGGEEFLVLEGTFSDQTGDFPAMTYVRNPIGSGHKPFTIGGCRIFVKLCQMQPEEQGQTVIRFDDSPWEPDTQDTRKVKRLFENPHERVWIEAWQPGTRSQISPTAGRLEVLILEGEWRYQNRNLETETWMRIPAGGTATLDCPNGGKIWCKQFLASND